MSSLPLVLHLENASSPWPKSTPSILPTHADEDDREKGFAARKYRRNVTKPRAGGVCARAAWASAGWDAAVRQPHELSHSRMKNTNHTLLSQYLH
jgi:hypothetical protein